MVEIDHRDIHLKYNLENHKQINFIKKQWQPITKLEFTC